MKATLVVEGKEFPIEINDPELQKLITPPKKTGYERVGSDAKMYYQHADGYASVGFDHHNATADKYYDSANYYSDKHVAENNARADRLMRQLRRFAVEHREKDTDWKSATYKYLIRFGHNDNTLLVDTEILGHSFGMIAFDSKKAAELAIDTFRDELIWYFTEYKDSL